MDAADPVDPTLRTDCFTKDTLISFTSIIYGHMNILMKLEVLLYCLKVSGEFALFLLLKNCAMTYPLPRFKKKIANSLVWNT